MSSEVAVKMYGRWKRYPAYRDSRVEWIGEVPEVWDVRKFNHIADNISVGFVGSIEVHYTDETGVLLLKTGNIGLNKLLLNDVSYVTQEFHEANVKSQLSSGDIIIARHGDSGKSAVIPDNISEANCLNVVKLKKSNLMNGDFYAYLLNSNKYQQFLNASQGGSVQGVINTSDIIELKVVLPPSEEQHTIAAFLDLETGRIDTLIEKKERQVELLQEKRATLISHAVTKGLDPDVMMKDSGVEWLGEVPDEWGIVRVKLLEGNDTSVVQTGPFGAQLHASDYLDEGVPFILIRNVRNLKIDETDIPRISEEDAERLFMYRLNVGDIVFSRVGSIGRIALCTEREKGWLISGQMLRLRIQNPMLDSKFSLYAFSSKCLLTFVELQSVGSTRESINTDILRNMPIPIPPLPEQRAIAAFLDRETGRIDTLTSKVSESLSKLREYRTAIISAAVTGKIDVRNKET